MSTSSHNKSVNNVYINPSISLTTTPLIPSSNNSIPSPNISLIHQTPHLLSTPISINPTIPIIPIQPQYIINNINPFQVHPTMSIPNTTPVIIVPNINFGISKPNISNNNAKIKAILEKKRTSPLSNEETKILEAAVASARQQFLFWYQQQAIRQRVALNVINPIQLQQLQLLQQTQTQIQTQTLTPKQINIINQQQLLQTLHAQQAHIQLQQQQLLEH
eukprot:400299_1